MISWKTKSGTERRNDVAGRTESRGNNKKARLKADTFTLKNLL